MKSLQQSCSEQREVMGGKEEETLPTYRGDMSGKNRTGDRQCQAVLGCIYDISLSFISQLVDRYHFYLTGFWTVCER
eukprot:scaffold13441_cov290-Alexandrium_tamarense.AAC.2